MELIPINILQNKIFYFLLPDKYCDLQNLYNLKLVNKTWYNIVHNINTWVNFLKKNNHKIEHFKDDEYFIKYSYSSHNVYNRRTFYLYDKRNLVRMVVSCLHKGSITNKQVK